MKIKPLLLTLGAMFFLNAPAHAEAVTDGLMEPNVQATWLIDGMQAFDEPGIYRIDDYNAGYHIYIVITRQSGSSPRIFVEPMKEEK